MHQYSFQQAITVTTHQLGIHLEKETSELSPTVNVKQKTSGETLSPHKKQLTYKDPRFASQTNISPVPNKLTDTHERELNSSVRSCKSVNLNGD
jgi:hypothetical protein